MALLQRIRQIQKLVENNKLLIILGSKSPRRNQLLKTNILADMVPFAVIASDFKEDFDTSKYHGKAKDLVREYAKLKALDVKEKYISGLKQNQKEVPAKLVLIIGCDTVVEQDGVILEKPTCESEAKARLLSYSNRSHSVISGVSLLCLGCSSDDAGVPIVNLIHEETFSNETKVTFAELNEELVEAYIQTGEPMDKAGGYGIQGFAASMIRMVEGCYYNVVGLPVQQTSALAYKALLPYLDKLDPESGERN
mmetsp:Transcript_3284/g.4384  ORF Transcript_3284/g.4384 Transcript_3284/m.4384 type:complete len:252 (+) Transcript_3284:159-914(+)